MGDPRLPASDLQSLEIQELALPLAATEVAVGPSQGRPGNRYIQGHADKACLEVVDVGQTVNLQGAHEIQISLVAEVVEPYAVFLRHD